jgi:hypothetical protein
MLCSPRLTLADLPLVLKKIVCGMLENASDSRPTLRTETLELLPNIMEGAVRECLCCQASS